MRASLQCLAVMFFLIVGSIPLVLSAVEVEIEGPSIEDNMELISGTDYFIRNMGQHPDDDVRFYSNDRNVMITSTSILIGSQIPEEDLIWVIGLTPQCTNSPEPAGDLELEHVSNYFYGNDPSGWRTSVPHFNGVVFPNIYDGIDLMVRPDDVGMVKYEFIVGPGADPDDIRMRVDGIEDLEVEEDRLGFVHSDLLMEERDLITYYLDDPEHQVETSFFKMGENIFGFEVLDHDRERALVIDPIVYSTYIGPDGYQDDERGDALVLDPMDNPVITGMTKSSNYPTTPGVYDRDFNGGTFDCTVFKMMPTGGNPNSTGTSLVFATYLGGSADDVSYDIQFDMIGNIVITGTTRSSNFPTTSGAYDTSHNGGNDIFVAKFRSDCSDLLYSTFYGGTGDELATSLDQDLNGNVFAFGFSTSTDLPTTSGVISGSNSGGRDAVVGKFNPSLSSLLISTYIGGTEDEQSSVIKVTTTGIYLYGHTLSSDFPVRNSVDITFNGESDMFLTRVNTALTTILNSTFIGGMEIEYISSNYCNPSPMDIGPDGSIFLTGNTESSNFPVTLSAFDTTLGGVRDAFVVKINSALTSIHYATYIGGPGIELGHVIEVDTDGCPVVAGITKSSGFPVTRFCYDDTYSSIGTENDAFLLKLDIYGSDLLYSTYLGGRYHDDPYDVKFNSIGNVFLTGKVNSDNFPTTSGAYDDSTYGYDAFLIKWVPLRKPSKPINLQASGDPYEVTISWDPPVYDGGSPISNYTIYKSLDNSSFADLGLVSGDTESYTDDQVTIGRIYYYKVKAANMVMEGDFSQVIDFATGTEPSPPVNLSGIEGNEHVLLSWDEPLDDGEREILSYTIYRRSSGEDLKAIKTILAPVRVYNDTNLINGVNYTYSVSASNDIGESLRSDEISRTPVTVPSIPLYFNHRAGDSFVQLDWEPPAYDGGSPVLFYFIYRMNMSSNYSRIAEVRYDQTEYNDTDVQNGMVYHYKLGAVNRAGCSPLTFERVGAPMTRPTPPWNLSISSGDRFVHLDWNEPVDNGGAELIRYYVYRRTIDGSYERHASVDSLQTDFNDTHVNNGVTYSYMVTAENEVGESPPTEQVFATPKTYPSPPRDLKVESWGDGFIELSWNRSLNDGGIGLTGYRLYRSLGDGDFEMLTTLLQYKKTFLDEFLQNGVLTRYYIEAYNEVGTSDPSDIVSAIPMTIPSTILDLGATVGDEFVELTWNPPSDNGGSELIYYVVYRGPSRTEMELFERLDPSKNSFNDTSVINGETYFYSISAQNSMGESIENNFITARPVTVPGMVQNLIVVSGDAFVFLEWDEPSDDSGDPITGYKIFRSVQGPVMEVEMIGVTGPLITFYNDTPVENGLIYNYHIIAYNTIGDGEPSVNVQGAPEKEEVDEFPWALVMLIALISILFLGVVGILLFTAFRKASEKKETIDGQGMVQPTPVPPPYGIEGGYIDQGSQWDPSITQQVSVPVQTPVQPDPTFPPQYQQQMGTYPHGPPPQVQQGPMVRSMGPPQMVNDPMYQQQMTQGIGFPQPVQMIGPEPPQTPEMVGPEPPLVEDQPPQQPMDQSPPITPITTPEPAVPSPEEAPIPPPPDTSNPEPTDVQTADPQPPQSPQPEQE
jgi:fibronectin type 3 domain-containing protein